MNNCRLMLALFVLLLPAEVLAGGTCSGVRGGCGRSAYRSSSRSPISGGTVHVSGYYRKDGTYVRPHTRRAPGAATYDHSYLPVAPAIEHRAKARTTARTTAWNGNVAESGESVPPRARTNVLGSSTPLHELRRWTDESGTFTVIAKFGGMAGETVTLHKIDGSSIALELGQLSEADQLWIQSRDR